MSKIMLVGCDLETGGLNGYETLKSGERVHGALHYPILEMAFVICDDKLNEVASFSVGIWDESFLERMDPWALDAHTKSGLIDQLRNATGDHDFIFSRMSAAEEYIIDAFEDMGIKKYDRKAKTGGILFGNSVGFDVSYLDAQMPALTDFFHYRTIDVSSIDLLRQTAWASVGLPKVEKTYAHTAMSDISETLGELKAYTESLTNELRDESWKMDFKGEKVFLSRWIDGRVEESYRPLNRDEAVVSVGAILAGFQPPRSLTRLDKPAD